MLAVVGGVLTVIAAIPMAWLSMRAPGRLQRVLEGCNYIVGSLPGVVVALALVTITVRVALPLYQTVVTHAARLCADVPAARAGRPARQHRAGAGRARAGGRQPRPRARSQALWSVTMRLAAPGAAAGVALVALGITNELTATLMLAPNGTRTLATAFWALTSELDYAAAAPYALIMVALSLPLTWLLYAQSRRMAGR